MVCPYLNKHLQLLVQLTLQRASIKYWKDERAEAPRGIRDLLIGREHELTHKWDARLRGDQ